MSKDDLPSATGPCDFCGTEKEVSRTADPFDMEIRHRYTTSNICHTCYYDRIEKVAVEQGINWRRKGS